jgi:hypothetical protein
LTEQDPNEAYNKFHAKYSELYDLCFPLEQTSNKHRKNVLSPWITKCLLTSIKKRKKLYKKLFSSPYHTRESYKNKLNYLIRTAKRTYYDNRFNLEKTNLKETWKLINEVINKSKCKTPLSPTFNYGNKILTDQLEIANGVCEYFSNVGPNFAKKNPDVNTTFSTFYLIVQRIVYF